MAIPVVVDDDKIMTLKRYGMVVMMGRIVAVVGAGGFPPTNGEITILGTINSNFN